MSKKIKIIIITFITLAILAGIRYSVEKVEKGHLFVHEEESIDIGLLRHNRTDVFVGGEVFRSAVVNQDATRSLGLSGVRELQNDEGMLFVFDTEESHGFWMRNMMIPLDIMWIDTEKKIVHLEENVSPKTFPRTFGGDVDSLYVLEVKVGTVEEKEIKVGDPTLFEIPSKEDFEE